MLFRLALMNLVLLTNGERLAHEHCLDFVYHLLCQGMAPLNLFELLLRLGVPLFHGLVHSISFFLILLGFNSFALFRPEIGIQGFRVLHDLEVCVVIPGDVLFRSGFTVFGFRFIKHPAEKLPQEACTQRLEEVINIDI